MDAYSLAVSSAAERVGPAVVKVESGRSGGSGFVFDSSGRVLTNEHVVRGRAQVQATLADGRRLLAGVVGADPRLDIAVLKLSAKGLPVAELHSGPLKVGQLVVAIGNPYGLEHTVTAGIVSAKHRVINQDPDPRRFDDFIQTDAAINPGNSGGPLVDAQGRVIGITTAIIPFARGVGFAVPVSSVLAALARFEEMRHRDGARLGIVASPTQGGVLVLEVEPDSPAARASLREQDVIVALGGRDVTSIAQVTEALQSVRPGQTVEVTFLRQGRRGKTTVVL